MRPGLSILKQSGKLRQIWIFRNSFQRAPPTPVLYDQKIWYEVHEHVAHLRHIIQVYSQLHVMPHYVASDLGVHCLPMTSFMGFPERVG